MFTVHDIDRRNTAQAIIKANADGTFQGAILYYDSIDHTQFGITDRYEGFKSLDLPTLAEKLYG